MNPANLDFRFSLLCLYIFTISIWYSMGILISMQHNTSSITCNSVRNTNAAVVEGGNRTIRALAGPVCMKNLGHAIFFTRCPPSYLLPVAVTERHPVDESRKYVHTVWKLVATKWLGVLLRRWFYSMNKYSALLPVWWSIFCSKGKLQISKLNR